VRGSLFSRRGLLIVAVSVVSLIGGALLAWWQWTRYQSASGTLQNLGYVLQWPLFGVFPAFMFYRISQADKRLREADELAEAAEAAEAAQAQVPQPRAEQPADQAAKPVNGAGPTVSADEWIAKRAYVQKRISTDAAEDDEDQALLAYNQRLAQLSASEERHAG
jgi:DNA-binding transcriptional regulator of glucitol operon